MRLSPGPARKRALLLAAALPFLAACGSTLPPRAVPAEALVEEVLARTGGPAAYAEAEVPEYEKPPTGLRPCCAFGRDLKARIGPVPVPFYQVGNLVTVGGLGTHEYGGGRWGMVGSLVGLNREKDGVVLTRRAGFLDTAHVRDTADNTFYLFGRLFPALGNETEVELGQEIADRRVVLRQIAEPATRAERIALAASLAGLLAYRLAEWHEIAQWYGYESVPGYPELVSAFSPEDLFSNLLGAKLAIEILSRGEGGNRAAFDAAMTAWLDRTLVVLSVQPVDTARDCMDDVDGLLWDSRKRLPDKWLVLVRDHEIATTRQPRALPPGYAPRDPVTLSLDTGFSGVPLDSVAELRLVPTKAARKTLAPVVPLPPLGYWTPLDFPLFAGHAREVDAADRSALPDPPAPRGEMGCWTGILRAAAP